VRTMKRDTRRFAKRQLSWFRADEEIIWSTTEEISDLYPTIEDFLNTVETHR
jgi:tRNA dimethylallyltransferase